MIILMSSSCCGSTTHSAVVDLDAILEIVGPEIHVSQTDQLPWGGEYDGYEGLATFFGRCGTRSRRK